MPLLRLLLLLLYCHCHYQYAALSYRCVERLSWQWPCWPRPRGRDAVPAGAVAAGARRAYGRLEAALAACGCCQHHCCLLRHPLDACLRRPLLWLSLLLRQRGHECERLSAW